MAQTHEYTVTVDWTGGSGGGTTSYTAYSRDHEVRVPGKVTIAGSSDPTFRGDPGRHNPEELLVAALSQCHLLWFLHLCASDGVVVTSYVDAATGTMVTRGGTGRFTEVVLHPVVTVTDASMVERVPALHHAAHEACFIANSVNFPVRCEPVTRVAEPSRA